MIYEDDKFITAVYGRSKVLLKKSEVNVLEENHLYDYLLDWNKIYRNVMNFPQLAIYTPFKMNKQALKYVPVVINSFSGGVFNNMLAELFSYRKKLTDYYAS